LKKGETQRFVYVVGKLGWLMREQMKKMMFSPVFLMNFMDFWFFFF